MFQNIKVDIIYYKTNTDFEMEFNLCGCCRMRLLTDKSPDRQTLVHSLARAVSRSKVIIVTGNLFGENGIMNIVAGAIGNNLALADNKACGIDSTENIEIINGSIPLVTPEGIFGGCIIENGPQTMILLSDSKNIRKSIMQTLIHPYIEELCADELKEKAAVTVQVATEKDEIAEEVAQEEEAETEVQEETQTVEETENIEVPEEIEEEETLEETPEDDVVLSGGMIFETEDGVMDADVYEEEESDLFVEPMPIDRKEARFINETYAEFEEENPINMDDDDSMMENYRKSFALDLPILIISVLLLVLIAFLCYCIFYVPAKYGVAPTDYIRDIFTTLF